jgi:hypothetical protein
MGSTRTAETNSPETAGKEGARAWFWATGRGAGHAQKVFLEDVPIKAFGDHGDAMV